jgi:hypothetical protein
MSFWASATVAANRAVTAPTTAMSVGTQSADWVRIGLMRTIR